MKKDSDKKISFTEDRLEELAREFANASLATIPPEERSYVYFKDDIAALRAYEEIFLNYARSRVHVLARPDKGLALADG